MKQLLKWAVPSFFIGALVYAGTIKTWSNADALTAQDLNNNFSHIHNLMVGGHGARLSNADVAANAAISASKLASYRFFPRTWAVLLTANAGCGTAAAACTETTAGATSIVGTAVGSYTVTLGYTATDSTYGVQLSIMNDGAVTGSCQAYTLTTTSFLVRCRTDVPANADMGFTVVVYDDN